MENIARLLPDWMWLTIMGIALVLFGTLMGVLAGFIPRLKLESPKGRFAAGGAALGSLALVILGSYAPSIKHPPTPTLVRVPSLDRMSKDEAMETLKAAGLQGVATTKESKTDAAGEVIPKSQSPEAGQNVKPGTSVSFQVAVLPIDDGDKAEKPKAVGTAGGVKSTVTLSSLKSGGELVLRQSNQRLYHGEFEGTWTGKGAVLVLWIQPTNPGAPPFWFLQRGGNGISVGSDGHLKARLQLGNETYPPETGHTFDLAITAVTPEEYRALTADQGEASSDSPAGKVLLELRDIKVKVAR